jgi:hypothetical protein
LSRARIISESINDLLCLHEFNLGKYRVDLDKLVGKDDAGASDLPADDAETDVPSEDDGTEVDPTDKSVDNTNTEAGQTAEPKTLKKPRKVFTNIRKIVDEVIQGYPTEDFKAVINKVSDKYDIPPLRLVRLFMHRTGTLATELPNGYSYGEFVPPPETAGGGDEGM